MSVSFYRIAKGSNPDALGGLVVSVLPDLFLTRDILLLRYQMALVVESG
jgi:hypothetical protein